jgi:hypothetical protein
VAGTAATRFHRHSQRHLEGTCDETNDRKTLANRWARRTGHFQLGREFDDPGMVADGAVRARPAYHP